MSRFWQLSAQLASDGIAIKAMSRTEAARVAARARWGTSLGGMRTTPVGPNRPVNLTLDEIEALASTDPPETGLTEEDARKFRKVAGVLATRLLDQYEAVEPGITSQMEAFAAQFGAELEGLNNRLKKKASLANKIFKRTIHENLGTPAEVAEAIPDVTRYSMVIPDANYSRGAKTVIDSLRQEGSHVRVKNTWDPSSSYRAVNIAVTRADDLRFEIQFHTPVSLETKRRNHKLYKLLDTVTDPVERGRIQAEMSAAAAGIPAPPDWSIIKQMTTTRYFKWMKPGPSDEIFNLVRLTDATAEVLELGTGDFLPVAPVWAAWCREDPDFVEIDEDEAMSIRDEILAEYQGVKKSTMDKLIEDLQVWGVEVRKMSRSEAGRVAALARWRSRAGYEQRAKVTGRGQTTEIEPFDRDAFLKAAKEGPVVLLGVHGSHGRHPMPSPGKQGSGMMGEGTYASLIDPSGLDAQERHYRTRPDSMLLELRLEKPFIIDGRELSNKRDNQSRGTQIQYLLQDAIIDLDKTGIAFREGQMAVLKKAGYDSIVYIHDNATSGGEHGSQVSVFDAAKSVKVLDPVVSRAEFQMMSERAGHENVSKAAIPTFNGENFDLVPFEMLGRNLIDVAQ